MFLGILQGLTEFLPVSSSGHLALAHRLVGTSGTIVFDVGVHVGTALAVAVVMRRELVSVIRGFVSAPFRKDGSARLGILLIVTTIPAAVAGYVFHDLVEQAFDSVALVGLGLLVTGLLLFAVERPGPGGARRGSVGVTQMRLWDALVIGIAQAFAILPGISRSGATICAGLATGLKREFAASYSFLASLPVILGAGVLEATSVDWSGMGGQVLPLAFGMASSFVSGVVAMTFLLSLVRRRRLSGFAYYVWAVGLAALAWGSRGLWPLG
ncbi:MAG: undecaprenyl-diphosphate phosphatase [Firmicutes bacterium]|nr:undecaprenyl-diphosphate phosphatase [Bacillota bacterium]